MKRKIVRSDSANIRRQRLCTSGLAARFIRKLNVRRGHRYYLWCRVSRRQQRRGENAADQGSLLREHIESRGGIVVGEMHYTGSGHVPSKANERDEHLIVNAAIDARRLHATLVAESTDRFCRNALFSTKAGKERRATNEEMEELRLFTGDVPLATLLDPDAAPCEVMSHQRKRGQVAKGHFGGRPTTAISTQRPGYKKRRRMRLQSRAIEMYRANSYSQIAEELKVPRSTVQDWITAHRR